MHGGGQGDEKTLGGMTGGEEGGEGGRGGEMSSDTGRNEKGGRVAGKGEG